MTTPSRFKYTKVAPNTYEVHERGSYAILGIVQRGTGSDSGTWSAWAPGNVQVVDRYPGSRETAAGNLLSHHHNQRYARSQTIQAAPETVTTTQAELAEVLAKLDAGATLTGLSYQEQAALIMSHLTPTPAAAAAPRPETCPLDGAPLSTHIGGKPCVTGKPSTAKNLHDLPVTRWAHDTDN